MIFCVNLEMLSMDNENEKKNWFKKMYELIILNALTRYTNATCEFCIYIYIFLYLFHVLYIIIACIFLNEKLPTLN